MFQKKERDFHPDLKGKDKSNMKKMKVHSKSEMSFTGPYTIGSARVKPPIILIHSPENYNIWMCSLKKDTLQQQKRIPLNVP